LKQETCVSRLLKDILSDGLTGDPFLDHRERREYE